MIVISGALVLVALVLLVLGLTMTDLDFVYGSIGVSLVSFVFLVIGILQRRGEPAPAAAPPVTDETAGKDDAVEAEPTERTAALPVASRSVAKAGTAGSVPVGVPDVEDDELEPGGGPVLIVAGRPRYHVDGCRYLIGKTPEEIDVLDAQDDGFTPCGVCKPDQVLEELYGPFEDDEDVEYVDELDDEPAEDDVVDTGVPGTADAEPAPARSGRGRSTSTVVGSTALDLGGSTSGRARPAKAGTAAKAGAAAKDKGKGGARNAPAAPAVAPTAAPGPAKTARGKVVVIPDRDRFHQPSCRFVRDALGTEELTRGQADKQGYRACGVCKP